MNQCIFFCISVFYNKRFWHPGCQCICCKMYKLLSLKVLGIFSSRFAIVFVVYVIKNMYIYIFTSIDCELLSQQRCFSLISLHSGMKNYSIQCKILQYMKCCLLNGYPTHLTKILPDAVFNSPVNFLHSKKSLHSVGFMVHVT